MGVRVLEGRNGVAQMVSYPGYPGLSGRVNELHGWEHLSPHMVVCSWL